MDHDILLELATDLGYELAMSGAETFRVEESVSRVLGAYGIQAEVFAIPNLLIVSIITEDAQPITRMRRIAHHGSDLDAVEKYNGLSRAICSRKPEPMVALQWLKDMDTQRKNYSMSIQYVGSFLGAGGFAFFFGGCYMDSLCAGLCGILVSFVNKLLDDRKANQFFRTIISAFFMALLAYFLGSRGIAHNSDAVTIGALMLLVPGLPFTNAMRDVIYGDTNSGINRIVQVLLVAVALALGTGTAWRVATTLWGVPFSDTAIVYPVFAQCLFSLVSCIGFAILFNIHGPGGLLCALGGGLSWAVYCIATDLGGSDIAAYFWSALFSSIYSEIMARTRKYPAISYLVVSIFPLIPGAGVYYTMNYGLQGNMEAFATQGMHTAAIAGIIAVGILLGSTAFRMYSEWRLHKK